MLTIVTCWECGFPVRSNIKEGLDSMVKTWGTTNWIYYHYGCLPEKLKGNGYRQLNKED